MVMIERGRRGMVMIERGRRGMVVVHEGRRGGYGMVCVHDGGGRRG
jgi:hypothetical protein